jgi:hypothetical protein
MSSEANGEALSGFDRCRVLLDSLICNILLLLLLLVLLVLLL